MTPEQRENIAANIGYCESLLTKHPPRPRGERLDTLRGLVEVYLRDMNLTLAAYDAATAERAKWERRVQELLGENDILRDERRVLRINLETCRDTRAQAEARVRELEAALGLRNTPADTAIDDWYRGKDPTPPRTEDEA